MNTQLQDLQNKLNEKRDAWVTADEKTRAELMTDARIIKAQIKALEIAQSHEKSPYVPFRCPHPYTEQKEHEDKTITCEKCNTVILIGKGGENK